MIDDLLRDELSLLSSEAARVRSERPGVRIQWSEDFRKRAASLVIRGLSIREVAREVGVNTGTVVEWRRRMDGDGGFAELKIVPQRKSSGAEVRLRTRSGTEMTLGLSEVKALIREGIL
jgi:transposase-like protein